MKAPLTIGAVAERFGVAAWQVRRLYERGILPPAARVGTYRIIDPADLPRIETALRTAGYLPPGAVHIAEPMAAVMDRLADSTEHQPEGPHEARHEAAGREGSHEG